MLLLRCVLPFRQVLTLSENGMRLSVLAGNTYVKPKVSCLTAFLPHLCFPVGCCSLLAVEVLEKGLDLVVAGLPTSPCSNQLTAGALQLLPKDSFACIAVHAQEHQLLGHIGHLHRAAKDTDTCCTSTTLM